MLPNYRSILCGETFFFFFVFFPFLGLLPVAYGESQARGRIRAVDTSLHPSSRQRRILHPLSEAGGGTHSLMVPSRVR